jgi:hypothetical protein
MDAKKKKNAHAGMESTAEMGPCWTGSTCRHSSFPFVYSLMRNIAYNIRQHSLVDA